MINNRQSFRLRKQFDVTWSIPDQKIKGEGKIFNISLSGLLFATDKLFVPEHGLIISFPSSGKLTWFSRKSKTGKAYYLCGVKFLYGANFSSAWGQWMEDNILEMADTEDSRVLNRYLTTEE